MKTFRPWLYLSALLTCAGTQAVGAQDAAVPAESPDAHPAWLSGPQPGIARPGTASVRQDRPVGHLGGRPGPRGAHGGHPAAAGQYPGLAMPLLDRQKTEFDPSLAATARVDAAFLSAVAYSRAGPQTSARPPGPVDDAFAPEPSTCLLLALGLGIVWLKRRRSDSSRWLGHPD